MKQGFIIGNGTYAAVPFEDKLMIIYNGQQLDVVNTEQQARTYIQQHKKLNPKPRAPRKPRTATKSQKNQESTVTPKKPSTRRKKST